MPFFVGVREQGIYLCYLLAPDRQTAKLKVEAAIADRQAFAGAYYSPVDVRLRRHDIKVTQVHAANADG